MKTTWTSGLTGQEKIDITASFNASTVIRRRLAVICNTKSRDSYALTKDQYENPNWNLLQADAIGYKRAMREIVSILGSE